MNGAVLLAVATAVLVSTVIVRAQDNKFTCQVYSDSFALDDADFAAMASAGMTREKFAAPAPSSQMRVSVCHSRKLWRLIKAGKVNGCDLDRYENYAAKYFGPSEREIAVAAVAKAMAEEWPLPGQPKRKCP